MGYAVAGQGAGQPHCCKLCTAVNEGCSNKAIPQPDAYGISRHTFGRLHLLLLIIWLSLLAVLLCLVRADMTGMQLCP